MEPANPRHRRAVTPVREVVRRARARRTPPPRGGGRAPAPHQDRGWHRHRAGRRPGVPRDSCEAEVKRLASAWVELWDRREDAAALALVRIFVAIVLLYDLVTIWRLDLIEALYARPP